MDSYYIDSLLNCFFLRYPHISTPYSIPLSASDYIRKGILLRLLIRAFLNIPLVAFLYEFKARLNTIENYMSATEAAP